MKKILLGTMIGVAVLALGACKATENCGDGCGSACSGGCETDGKAAMTASPAAFNTTCPFSGEPVKAGVTSTYNGKTVGFCCNGCKEKFEKASAADKDAMLAKVK